MIIGQLPTHGDSIVISGLITGDPRYREKFRVAAVALRELGCDVFNPAELPDGKSYNWYMQRCYEEIRARDALWQLDDWVYSFGAKTEYMLAAELGKDIYPKREPETTMFICDPCKARICTKKHCYVRVWGSDKLCAFTPIEEMARRTRDGIPIVADSERIRDYIEGRCV